MSYYLFYYADELYMSKKEDNTIPNYSNANLVAGINIDNLMYDDTSFDVVGVPFGGNAEVVGTPTDYQKPPHDDSIGSVDNKNIVKRGSLPESYESDVRDNDTEYGELYANIWKQARR